MTKRRNETKYTFNYTEIPNDDVDLRERMAGGPRTGRVLAECVSGDRYILIFLLFKNRPRLWNGRGVSG